MTQKDKVTFSNAGSTVSDAGLSQYLGYHLKRASDVIQTDLARVLKPFDLRVLTFSALVLIDENQGLSQTQLADAMGMERPNLVAIVDALEQRGLVQRQQAPTDRRAYALQITPQGKTLCATVKAAVALHESTLLQDLDDATRTTVIAAMKTIRQAT